MAISWLRFFGRHLHNGESLAQAGKNTEGTRVSVNELIRLRFRVNGMRLQERRSLSNATAGGHLARFRGRGVDYQESRAYQPGDDIRTMDWRVTARMGRPHTKLYREERERPVIVMVDLGPSMFFATRVAFKSVIAAQAAACIAWITIHQGDRIGAFLFGAGKHHEIRPSGGHQSALRLLRDLADWVQSDKNTSEAVATPMGEALRRLRRVARPGSLVIILSDFYSLCPDTEHHLTRLRQHNDVIACQVADTLEVTAPPPGRYGITNGRRVNLLDTSAAAARRHYEAYFADHHKRIQALMRRRAVPLLRLMTHEDVVEGLRRGFAALPRGMDRQRKVN